MNANIFADTSRMSREEWLNVRTQGIGGSDVSVIAGINPYRSVHQLWLEKTGQTEPCESGNEYTHFGTILEPIVKQEFTERTGIEIFEPKCIYQHKDYPFMLANLDGVVNVDGELCIFEAKTASAYKQDEWNDRIPPEYMMRKAVRLGYRSHNTTTCGLHVHIGRADLGETYEQQEDVISRIMFFFESHWNELFRFSRRTEASVEHWAARHGYNDRPKEILEKAKKSSKGRYACVNISNVNTVDKE